MADVNDYIKQIQNLQKQTNDAIVRRNTELSKKQTLLQQLQQLQKKCQKQFGCSIAQLKAKRQQYEQELKDSILNLKKVLGVDKDE